MKEPRYNFRSKTCYKCGQIYNGNEPLSHNFTKCLPTKEYKAKMKSIGDELKNNKNIMKALKKFNKVIKSKN